MSESKRATRFQWRAWDGLNHNATDLVPTMGQNTGMASGRAGVIFLDEVSDRDQKQEETMDSETTTTDGRR